MADDFLSFDPIMQTINAVKNLTEAVAVGNAKFINNLPAQFNSTISNYARQRLNHTANNLISSVKIDLKDDIILVEIDPNNKLAVWTETGKDAWNMHDTHLSGPKTKISKAGYRYKIIPLKIYSTSPSASTDLAKDYFEKVKKVLKKPKFGNKWSDVKPEVGDQGQVVVWQEVLHNDPDIQGMFNKRAYKSQDDLIQGKKPTSSQFVLFRTISDANKDKWQHPGIKPANILKDALKVIEDEIELNWDKFVQVELHKKGFL